MAFRLSDMKNGAARLGLAVGVVALLGAVVACNGNGTSIDEEPCDHIDCEEGLFCDEETEECVCDGVSCGEAMACRDGTECVEDPLAACGWGAEWSDEGCVCDEQACSDDGGECTGDGTRCLFAADAECIDGAEPWDGGESIFEERSEEAGLTDPVVEGVRLATADVTGSGYPDLFVRRANAGADDFETQIRHSWFLENQGDGTFEDVTEESGLLQRRYDNDETRGRPAEVFAFADVTNDGSLDAVTLPVDPQGTSQEGAEVMLNDGEGNFELGPVSDEHLHASAQRVNPGGASFVDVDRNGIVDLWVGYGPGESPQDRLYLGDGSGDFEDVTVQRGLETEQTIITEELNQGLRHSNAWSAAACDLDGNTRPELLAASYGRLPNHLWNATADDESSTMYENHSVDSGYAYNTDRLDWTDNESARCFCQLNPDAEDCEGVAEPEHIPCEDEEDVLRWNHDTDRFAFRLGGNSGTTVCADLNNNGHLDLLTTEIRHWDVGSSSDPSEILYNTGESPPRFERPGNEETGLERPRDSVTWDEGDITAAAFDFDNSGRLDILIASTDYPGTRAHLFHQKADGTFLWVPVELGIDLTSAHGIAVADFNRNGALDVAIGHSQTRCSLGDHCLDSPNVRFFKNQIGDDANWLQLDLEGGEGTNRAAIGARVTVEAGELMRTAEVDGGHGHYGVQHDLVQHFGLGEECEATVVVEWPDEENSRDVYRLGANERYHIRQGETPEIVE